MASKGLFVLGVLSIAVLLTSSEVLAKEQAQETSEMEANKASVQDQKGRGVYNQGYGCGGYGGGGYGGGGYGGGGHGGGGGCRCCGHGYYGGCRCCNSPDEIPEPEYIPEVQH